MATFDPIRHHSHLKKVGGDKYRGPIRKSEWQVAHHVESKEKPHEPKAEGFVCRIVEEKKGKGKNEKKFR